MAGYTKGPWSSEGNRVVSGDTLVAVAEAGDEAEANVRLIRSAPDLYVSLSLSLPILEQYHADHSGSEAGRVWYVLEAVRAALAAATETK